MENRVFVNRVLNLRHIKYIGLDMDHTLIRYHTERFESKVYELMIDFLIKDRQYPMQINQLTFNFNLAIRGLVIDKCHGNILKLSRYGGIKESYHGTNPINKKAQRRFYRGTYVDLSDSNFIPVDTAFSIAVCVLYAQLVDLKDEFEHVTRSYEQIAKDVINAVDHVHSEGILKKHVSNNLEHFIIKDEALISGMQRFLKHGKKIFIITNSDYAYTKTLLDYAINPFLDEGQNWTDLFEYVITLADKPRFFYDNLKFLNIAPDSGLMSNLNGKLSPGIYQGGCATKFTQDLALDGDQILYIGDHIYGDVLRLKKDCNWRTALVIEELGDEIVGFHKAEPLALEVEKLLAQKQPLEKKYSLLSSKKIEEQSHRYDTEIDDLLYKMKAIDKKIFSATTKQRLYFNHRWDRVFRAAEEESFFAQQVNRFACIYMEKISDFFTCLPRTYFKTNQRVFDHEFYPKKS